MESLSLLAPFTTLWGAVMFIIPFLAVITVIVFFHELGHFSVARFFGVKVDSFSIGFGREIIGWTDRKGTRWKIGWLPLGGYVKFSDDEHVASVPGEAAARSSDAGGFHSKPLWQRALIVAAGPLANFILAIVIFAGFYTLVGKPVLEPVVSQVVAGSPAEQAGIQPGDRILAIDGRKIESFTDISSIVALKPGREVDVVLQRGEQKLSLRVRLGEREAPDGIGGTLKVGYLGVTREAAGNVRLERKGPLEAVALGTRATWDIIAGTMTYLKEIIVGRQSADQLSGPIRIAQISQKAAETSWLSLVQLAAILSVSIGLINLFPIPMLDGGHLLFYAIEAVRGRPLSESAQEVGFRIGMAMLLMLMVFATFNDVMHLFNR